MSPKDEESSAPPVRRGKPAAAAAIWVWRVPNPASVSPRDTTRLRLTGLSQATAGAMVGLAAYLWWSRTIATLAFSVSALVLLAALVSPAGLYAGLQRLFAASGRIAGRGTTWVVMVPLFYLFFFPFGMLFRRGHRDRLKRFFTSEKSTYWEPRAPNASASKDRPY